MAQNNWTFYNAYKPSDRPNEGLAKFHTVLSDPLTVGGEYCREFYTNTGNSTDNYHFARCNVAETINIPKTKAISVRCWVRQDAWNNEGVAYISVKWNRSDAYMPGGGNGYHFGIRNGGFYVATNGHNITENIGSTSILGQSTANMWVHLRMDLIPIKHNNTVIMDNLKCYAEVDGEWVLVKEKYIESTDSDFVSWGNGTQYVGFGHWNWNYWQYSWFDKFEVFTETVEQPDALFLNLTNDTGPSSQDLITADSSITVSDAELGATRYYSLDNSNWSTSLPTFTSGSNILYAKQVSAEGRTSPVTTLEFTYIPDDSFLSMDSATSASVVENSGESQVIYTAQASNPYSAVSYSLKEVDDYLKFSINSSTGEVTLTEDPNFELSSSYGFTFKAQDLAGFMKERAVALSVTDQNEAPSFQVTFNAGTQANPLSEASAEDTVVATLSATDPENDSVAFSLISQTNEGLFAVSGSSLLLSGALDYEVSSSHSVTLRASDGQLNVDQTYTIYVGDVNEAPTFSLSLVSGSQANPLMEDSSAGLVIGSFNGSDVEGEALTFSIVSQSPADVFEISGSDLKLSGALDYEANTTHSLTLRVSDGVNNVDQNHTIYIGDIAESSITTDPDFSNVSLLLKMDGSNGSTTFTDDSSNNFTVTANGNAAISTTESKYDGASAYFDGSGDYLSIAHDSSLRLSDASQWTVEAWVYNTGDTSQYRPIFSKRDYSQSAIEWQFYLNQSSGQLTFYNGSAYSSGTTISSNQWVHLAFVGNNGSLTFYVNGTAVQTVTASPVSSTANPALNIEAVPGSSSENWSGYIDDVRITKGVARYTSDFTPPDSHPTS